jgi:hypothetical protein
LQKLDHNIITLFFLKKKKNANFLGAKIAIITLTPGYRLKCEALHLGRKILLFQLFQIFKNTDL